MKKSRTYAIDPNRVDQLSDIGVDAKPGAVMIFGNEKGRAAVGRLWSGLCWRTDDIFRLAHPDDWLFTHVVVTAIPPRLDRGKPLSEIHPDALGYLVAAALSAQPRIRVFHYSGDPPECRINTYKRQRSSWFKGLQVEPAHMVSIAPGNDSLH